MDGIGVIVLVKDNTPVIRFYNSHDRINKVFKQLRVEIKGDDSPYDKIYLKWADKEHIETFPDGEFSEITFEYIKQ